MKRWIILAVLVVAATAAATFIVESSTANVSIGKPQFPVAQKKGPHPKLVVDDELTYNFGTKPQRTTFAKDWVIRNEGDADLELRLEAPPCSCTVAGFQNEKGVPTGSTKVVSPKSQTTIHFTWETRDNNGPYNKPATILTNDPERPEVRFAADGRVYPALMVYPEPRVRFGDISTDKAENVAAVYVFSHDMPDMKITKLSTSKPEFFSAAQSPMKPEECKELKIKNGYKVAVTVKRGMPLAPFLEELRIETDHPKQSELKLTIDGKLLGPISVLPERIRISGIDGNKGGSQEITMIVRGGRATKFEVERHPERFKVDVESGDNSSKPGKYRLTVTVPPGTPSGTVDDLIILKTDHPEAKELRIPIYGYISDNDAG